MEIATLLVELVKTLVWPIVTVGGALWFRRELRQLLQRLLNAPEIELEYKGIKLKLKTLETLVQQGALEVTKPNVKLDTKVESEQKELLSTAASLEPKDIELLVSLRVPSPSEPSYYVSDKDHARAYRLHRMGLLSTGSHSDGVWIDLTTEGRKIADAAFVPSTHYGL